MSGEIDFSYSTCADEKAVSYPVVESYESRTLIGFVSYFDLYRYRQEIMQHLSSLRKNAMTVRCLCVLLLAHGVLTFVKTSQH